MHRSREAMEIKREGWRIKSAEEKRAAESTAKRQVSRS
jgi:hypothetical protein